MAMHHPGLDCTTICRGYADGWSADAIHALGESLVPYAQMVAEQVSTQWVMELAVRAWLKACARKMSSNLRTEWRLG